MRTVYEFRVSEKFAPKLFSPDDGIRLGDSIRKIQITGNDPRFYKIGEIREELLKKLGKPFFHGWDIRHNYSKKEIEFAKLFHLKITAVFEPAGEECGTRYDYSRVCKSCGAGRKQVGELVLDTRKVPKGKDIARTIADEWIISQRLAEYLMDTKMTGFELRPVRHKARYKDDAIDPTKYPSGRRLLQKAKLAGMPHPKWAFYVWLNKPEQAELSDKMWEEHVRVMQKKEKSRPIRRLPTWYQLVATSSPVSTVAPTKFGINPFDDDPSGSYRCPLGHVKGLNLLSEVWVKQSGWDGSDIACTKDSVGTRRGLLVPTPLLLISPRLKKLLEENKIKGYQLEIAHFE